MHEFRLNKTTTQARIAVAVILLLSTISIAQADTETTTNVTQVSLFIQESLIEVYAEPASTLIIPIQHYANYDQIEVTLSIIINMEDQQYLHWLYYSGLDSSVLGAVSAKGNIGYQRENQWLHYGNDGRIILTANGALDITTLKLKPGRTLIVGQLAYGAKISSTPLLTLSVFLEDPNITDDDEILRLQANVSLTKLELEIASIASDDIDEGYFNGLYWEGRNYYLEKNYQTSLTVSTNALEELRNAKRNAEGFIPTIVKFLQSYGLALFIPTVVVIGYGLLRKRNNQVEND